MMKSDDNASIDVESSSESKDKAPLIGTGKEKPNKLKKIMGVVDFVLRLAAIIAALAAATTMGTSDETATFFTQVFRIEASYDDVPTFTYVIIYTHTYITYIYIYTRRF